jgi:hypothetical protein
VPFPANNPFLAASSSEEPFKSGETRDFKGFCGKALWQEPRFGRRKGNEAFAGQQHQLSKPLQNWSILS